VVAFPPQSIVVVTEKRHRILFFPVLISFPLLVLRSIFDLSYIKIILAEGYLGTLCHFCVKGFFVKVLSGLVSRLLMFSWLKVPGYHI